MKVYKKIHVDNREKVILARQKEIDILLKKWKPNPELYNSVPSRNKNRFIRHNSNYENRAFIKFSQERKEIIQKYQERLNSSEWKKLRTELIAKNNNYCQNCKTFFPSYQLNLHHKHYRTVGQETEADLQVICQSCHKKYHKDQDYRKLFFTLNYET